MRDGTQALVYSQLYAMQEDEVGIQLHGVAADHSASAFYCRMSLQPHSTRLSSARLVSPKGLGVLVVWQSQTTGKCSIWVTFCNEKAQ